MAHICGFNHSEFVYFSLKKLNQNRYPDYWARDYWARVNWAHGQLGSRICVATVCRRTYAPFKRQAQSQRYSQDQAKPERHFTNPSTRGARTAVVLLERADLVGESSILII